MLGVYTPEFLDEQDGEEGTLVNVILYNTYADLMSCYPKMYLIMWMNPEERREEGITRVVPKVQEKYCIILELLLIIQINF